MNKKEFEELMLRVKTKNPRIFGLDSDCKPTVEDIEMMEKYYNIVFSKSYKDFLLQYGGGYFAFTIVYSLDKQSCFYIKNNVSVEFVKDNKIFPIIDFETGDLAGFKVYNGRCEDTIVLYNHEEKRTSDTKLNFYDALGKYGLKLVYGG
ncbi:MAG: SMI1/KNR4 family protein [Lachnospiraceae bacterium]|nr:SMI1/KNR4 family protein [Lachnospiraceae bacterium]